MCRRSNWLLALKSDVFQSGCSLSTLKRQPNDLPTGMTHIPNSISPPLENGRDSERFSAIHSGASTASPKVEEYRNMMRHILNKIHRRRRPPAALAYLAESYRTIEQAPSFDNDEVVDLLIQLRTALFLCEKSALGADILSYRYKRSPAALHTSSPTTSPQSLAATRSPEAEAAAPLSAKPSQSMFDNILGILDDLVLNDARYKSTNLRPSRPPYTMQTVLIDVATVLIALCDDMTHLITIGATMLPAFDSFNNSPLLGKLLRLYIDVLLPKLAQCGRHTKGQFASGQKDDSSIHHHQHTQSMAPTISIHSPDTGDIDLHQTPHLTINTRTSPIQSPKPFAGEPSDHATLVEANLYSSLLYFIIQYLDPYLSSIGSDMTEPLAFSITRQSYSIFNFHRALQYMINQKPDIHLDLLEVISYGSTEVKFRACQILFHYYGTSTGHVVVAEPLPEIGHSEELSVLRTAMERHAYEEECQRQRQQQTDPTFLETMIGSSATLNVTGINRKYRTSILQPTNGAIDQIDETTPEDERHVLYPHMFVKRMEESAAQLQRLSTAASLFSTVLYDDIDGAYCKECFKPIQGFGLRCYQCKCSLHYGCLGTNDLGIMLYVKEGGIQKVVSPQFSTIPLQPRNAIHSDHRHVDLRDTPEEIRLLGHHFQLVNLFTLIPCASCRLPLWGISYQGYRCATCNRFVHPTCLAMASRENGFKHDLSTIHDCQPYQPLRESDTQISQTDLCHDLGTYYDNMLPNSKQDLANRSFEEVSLMLNVLLLQDNILRCGVASGCLLISQVSDDPLLGSEWIPSSTSDASNIERTVHASPVLREALQLCMDYILTGGSQPSRFHPGFYSGKPHSQDQYLLSEEGYLSHICAMMKTPMLETNHYRKTHAADGHELLQVEIWDEEPSEADPKESPEVLDGDSMVQWMIENLRFNSRRSAEILLQHMRNLGLLERQDGSPVLFSQQNNPLCIFPVPFAIDFSSAVESVVGAIEACLADIDITLNECGMLLLVRRCWPDPFLSQYIRERLIHCVLSWIFDEDEKLTILHAEYTGSKQQLPGVRQNRWTQAAQLALMSRMKNGVGASDKSHQSISFSNTIGISSGTGSIYVTTRNALRDRYITRWMAVMHDMNPKMYAAMIFDIMEHIVDGKHEADTLPEWISVHDNQRSTVERFEEFVGYILKLKTYGLAFTAFDSILRQWLDKAFNEFDQQGILMEKEPAEIRNLPKLFSSKVSVPKAPVSTLHASVLSEPSHAFDVITSQFEAGDDESVSRGIRWLSLIMHAGTGVPSSSVTKIARYLVTAKASIKVTAEFIKLLWFQAVNILNVPLSRAVVIDVIGYLNEIALQSLRTRENSENLPSDELKNSQAFIKYSVALACFAYNCPLSNITDLNIVPYFGDHIAQLSQRKRASLHTENILSMHVDETTPIIRCMLEYLKFDHLNVRFDVLKLFYALIHWGFGISNKSDFISKCSSPLTTAIWETLPPSCDHMSDINLNLLMRLMNTDPRQFQACVYEIFENANWEVRFQGLDNVYGLFTKMDAAFQTKWIPMLSYLGPVFSYFVGSLWDKEEYVRSKAFGLIRTFGTLHLRSAFRCWEAYFLAATDQQKTSVIKLMIQLNALFPDWQVIQWESLLEGLETKQNMKSETHSVDILESYMRSSSNRLASTNGDQTIVESENAKVLMLTLALQMLSNHLPVDTIQVSRLKYIFVDLMGFSDCQRYAASGEWVVSFGDLSYDYTNALQCTCVLSASRGLKKIMDSFAPLPAETVASMAPDVLERNRLELAENSSPGVHFIDVVLKLFNSGIDLTKLNHMLLKIWLETVLIVMYKHNIVEREYEHSIVNCMKQIIDLLTKDISEENKLLILEILKCLLKRSDHLTAMVLSKQIMALGKLMTKLGSTMMEPVFLKAKEFLKSAFLRFALAGLFVLMFKNQTVSDANNKEVDLFFVLGTVIDPEDVVPDGDMNEIIFLRDQPVRDVLDKLMKQQMERSAFSTVIHNMCRYVEVVHSYPYSESILNDFALFLNTLVKHTAGWRRSEWDINPLFTMSAILLKEHPYHFTSLLPQIQVLFRQGLQNCTVHVENIIKLLASFSALSAVPGSPPENVFTQIIMEEAKEGLMHRQKLHKDTLLVILQMILWDSKPEYLGWFTSIENSMPGDTVYRQRRRTLYFEGNLHTILEPLVSFLKLPPLSQQYTKKDFKTCKTAAQLLVSICMKDQSNLTKILELQKFDESDQCLRLLDWFLLSVLQEESEQLTNAIDSFEDSVTELLMRTFNTIPVDFDTADVNFSYSPSGYLLLLCFLMLKIWALTVLQREITQERNSRRADTAVPTIKPAFWMLVWPTLRSLLGRIDSRTLVTSGNVGCSVWNMFLSLLQFLFVCRSGIVLVNAYEWSSLLEILHDQIPDSDSASEGTANHLKTQIANVLQMFTIPPVEVPMNILVDQLYLEIRDVMRLQAETAVFQTNGRPLQSGSAIV